jgi:adenosine deaminase
MPTPEPSTQASVRHALMNSLRYSFQMQYSQDFLFDMPKSDLHLHLDGSLRISSLIEMAKVTKTELPSFSEAGLREKVFKDHYANLGEYLTGFKYTCDVLRDMENLERASYELAMDNLKENVFYIEIRFAPQLLMDTSRDITIDVVLNHVNKGLLRAKKEFNQSDEVTKKGKPYFNYGIILCAMRDFGPQGFSPYYTNLFKMMKYFKSKEVVQLAAMELVKAAVRLRDEMDLPLLGLILLVRKKDTLLIIFLRFIIMLIRTLCIKLSMLERPMEQSLFFKRSLSATQTVSVMATHSFTGKNP